jgi:hypothetical protein
MPSSEATWPNILNHVRRRHVINRKPIETRLLGLHSPQGPLQQDCALYQLCPKVRMLGGAPDNSSLTMHQGRAGIVRTRRNTTTDTIHRAAPIDGSFTTAAHLRA